MKLGGEKSIGIIEFTVYRSEITEKFISELKTEQIKTALLQIEPYGLLGSPPVDYICRIRISESENHDYYTLRALRVFKRENLIFARIESDHLGIMELLEHLLNTAEQQGIPKLDVEG